MSGFPILEVAIGITFFYLVFALICTTANEAIARWLNKRPKTLEEAIDQLLGSQDLRNAVLNHPLICTLSREKSKDGKTITETPSYIPPHSFATALLDRLSGAGAPVTDMNAIAANLDVELGAAGILLTDGRQVKIPARTQIALQTIFAKSNGDWNKFHENVEAWYNSTMDRAEGWYKRYIQKQTYLLAAVIVLWVNFDTLQVARRLWVDSALRNAVVEQARQRTQQAASGDLPLATYDDPEKPDQGKPVQVESGGSAAPLTEHEQALIANITGWERDLQEVHQQIGTASNSELEGAKSGRSVRNISLRIWAGWIIMHLLGWTLSLLAISLGAPFWFDVLNRFMNLRNAGRAPDEPKAKNAPAPPVVTVMP
jgi:hypothetical protein